MPKNSENITYARGGKVIPCRVLSRAYLLAKGCGKRRPRAERSSDARLGLLFLIIKLGSVVVGMLTISFTNSMLHYSNHKHNAEQKYKASHNYCSADFASPCNHLKYVCHHLLVYPALSPSCSIQHGTLFASCRESSEKKLDKQGETPLPPSSLRRL